MSDVRILFSEALDVELYAYRLFPAITAVLAALALHPHIRRRLTGMPASLLKRVGVLALPIAGIPGIIFILLCVGSSFARAKPGRPPLISDALSPFLSVAAGLLVAIALVAAIARRRSVSTPGESAAAGPAAAVFSAVAGAGVFLLSMLLMLGLMQLPKYDEPILCLLGIAVPVGLTLGVAAWPFAGRMLAARPLHVRLAVAVAIGGGCMILASILLAAIGLPRQIPPVGIVAMTAFPLAAAAGLKAAAHVPLKAYALLFALRMLIVAGLVMFLARPMLSIQGRQSEKPALAIAVDVSGSMSTRDGTNAPTRLEWVGQTLSSRYLDALSEDFSLECFTFSGGTEKIDASHIRDLDPDGKTTDIAQAVARIKAALPGADIASVLLISDGIDNSGGRDPVKAVVEQGIIVNTVGVGALAEGEKIKDIAVKHVEAPRYTTVNNVAEIKAHVESSGIVATMSVILKTADKELAESRIVLEPGRKTHVVSLRFTPDAVGPIELEVVVPPAPEERIHKNNSYPVSVTVTHPRIKVLYIEAALRHEYKFLKRTLDMDPNVELLSFVQTRKDVFLKQGGGTTDASLLPADLDALKQFDVIILGDTDSTLFSKQQLEMIEQAVRDGAGLLMLGGEASFGPGGYADTPPADALPVIIGGRGDRQFKDAFMLDLTDDGREHAIFRGTLEFFRSRDKAPDEALPELRGNTEVLGRKPGATILAVNPDKIAHDGNPMIVAAVQQYGTGRSMAFTADTTWRWLFQMKTLGRDTPYVKFWGQAVRWLANEDVKERDQKPGISASSDKRSYSPGEKVRIFARARGAEGLATNEALLYAAVTAPSGAETPVQLTYAPGSAGEYEGTFAPAAPGEYAAAVTATLDGEPLGEPLSLEFRVGDPNLEFDDLDINAALLERIAAETGGQYYSLVSLGDLSATLRATEMRKRSHREVSLWDYVVMPVVNLTRGLGFIHSFLSFLAKDPQGMFFVFLVLVTVEWTMRKRRMLS